jgi:hypothetical protein
MIHVENKLKYADNVRFQYIGTGPPATPFAGVTTVRTRPNFSLKTSKESQFKATGGPDKVHVDTDLRFPNATAQKQRAPLIERYHDRFELIDPVLIVEPWVRGGKNTRNTTYDEV